MRHHLMNSFEKGKISPFPKYKVNIPASPINNSNNNNTSPWKQPRRSARLKVKSQPTPITTNNRFETLSTNPSSYTAPQQSIDIKSPKKTPISPKIDEKSIIYNISSTQLTSTEKNVLEKGLNFCPVNKDLNKKNLIDDVYAFCRKIRLKGSIPKSLGR